ncbi:hypothetical protein DSOUD_0835 [Desulfuromonas soudanensis]|uniref:Uncharacterized protein n=1 Tax=Desulfuromonas soudanensis TaxID=1603606 RepID=A0A0M4D4R3_9BACT|nr:hypothetical protein [Desulfuromonas soudanensis]ALC15622.1 hypothetical protein DSOUD_0835 [Desulfuromonas soudanensis]
MSRMWMKEEVAALLDEDGAVICPDCQTPMTTRARFIWLTPEKKENQLVAAVRCTCPSCPCVIQVDTQLQWATEWTKAGKCAG